MKTIRHNFLFAIMALGVFVFTSCEDEFTEEDFLDKQAELAAAKQSFDLEKLILEYQLIRGNDSASMVFNQQLEAYLAELQDAQETENIEALRQAGLIVSYTLTVENQGGVPIDSVAVSVGGNNPVARRDLSTSGGELVINDLPVGVSPIRMTATGYIGVAFTVDFGDMNNGGEFQVVGDRIYPLGRNEADRITMISSAGSTMGTVSGTATIETDVTNLTPEIPQNVTVTAYLDGAVADPFIGAATSNSGSVISDFRFIGEGIGSAVVDNTTGAWSMMLPATEGGISYTLQIPMVMADQTIVIDERDGVDIAPELATVPTMFGPSGTAGTYDAVSSVPGAKAVFTAAPAQGTGFGLTFTLFTRALSTGTSTSLETEQFTIGNDVYRLTSRGSGLSTSPTGTAANGIATGGTNATFTTAIAGRVTGLAIATAGTGYVVNDVLTVTVFPRDVNGNNTATDIDNDGNPFGAADPNDIANLQFTVTVASVDGAGAITGITLPTTGLGFGADAYFGNSVTQYVVTAVTGGSGATADFSVSSVSARVSAVTVATGGTLYNNSALPTITFTGGNGLGGTPTLPTLSLIGMAYEYAITPSGGTGYAVLPAMSYTQVTTFGGAVTTTGNVDIYDGTSVDADEPLISEFTLAGGVPVLENGTLLTYRTLNFTFAAPTAIITPDPVTLPVASLTITADGEITGLSASNVGSGFGSEFGVTIEPCPPTGPGSGAAISLANNFSKGTNMESVWSGGSSVVTRGSGYLVNANQIPGLAFGIIAYSGPSSVNVVSGGTYKFQIIYGTGNRTQDVD